MTRLESAWITIMRRAHNEMEDALIDREGDNGCILVADDPPALRYQIATYMWNRACLALGHGVSKKPSESFWYVNYSKQRAIEAKRKLKELVVDNNDDEDDLKGRGFKSRTRNQYWKEMKY